MKRIILVITMLLGMSLWAGNASAEIVVSDALYDDVGAAYTYYSARVYGLNLIAKKYPSLSAEAIAAKKEFSGDFKPSIDKMDKFVGKYFNTWQKGKKRISKIIVEHFSENRFTPEKARQYINATSRSARDDIKYPILETLLMFKPGYEGNPEREFIDGYKYKYSSDGSGKAKGMAFSIKAPKTWMEKDASEPSIQKKFVSGNGRGDIEFQILMQKMLPGKGATKKTISDLLASGEVKHTVPPGSDYIGGGKLDIENLPGFWTSYAWRLPFEESGVRGTISMEAIQYSVTYKNYMILMSGFVMTAINDEKVDLGGVDKHRKLFDLMANSLEIQGVSKK